MHLSYRPPVYRDIIDRMVERAQGQDLGVVGQRVRNGLWNRNATPEEMPEQWAMNDLLARLSSEDREVLLGMLINEYVGGMHDTLAILHDAEVPPFEDAYEGTPYHDFVGRLAGWEWPSS